MNQYLAPDKQRLHILLVDDDTFILDMYAKKFRDSGYEVTVSPRSEEALAELRNGLNPDILLLDIVMPELSGLDILQAIWDEGLVKDTAIIMLTNQGEETDIETAKNFGADGYIIKASAVPSEVVAQVESIYQESRELI